MKLFEQLLARRLMEGEPNGDGGQPPSDPPPNEFLATLPEDMRTNPAFKSINSVDDLAKSYLNAQSMVGADTIRIPGENAQPDEWNQVYSKLGKPDDPKNYTLSRIETFNGEPVPESYQPDEALTNEFREVAHKLNLTKAQAKDLYNWYQEREFGTLANFDSQTQEIQQKADAALRKQLGAAYDEHVQAAQTVVTEFGDKDFVEFMQETGLGNDPRYIKMMGELGKKMMEAEVIGNNGNKQFTITPDQAKMKISELQADAEFYKRYSDSTHPGHSDAVAEMNRLFKLANPDGPVQIVGGQSGAVSVG